MKRDDLTSTLYGGNKMRKLEFLLGDALKKGQRAVITFGAYGSNHALATAVHASALGLEPHVVLSPQAPGPFAARTLRAHAGLGTKLHLIDGWDGRRAAVEAKRELAARDGVEPAIIPMGGTNALGALGYVNAAFEVIDQAKTLDLGPLSIQRGDFVLPDVVYVAAGTLGTAIGLAVGFRGRGRPHEGRRRSRHARSRSAPTPSPRSSPPRRSRCCARSTPASPTSRRVTSTSSCATTGSSPATASSHPRPRTRSRKLRRTASSSRPPTPARRSRRCSATRAGGRLDRADHVLFWDTYNSGPMPPEGPDDALPPVLQDYVAECDRLFGRA